MSKYVKDLLTDHLKQELDGVSECLVVSIKGVDANANCELRRRLREKDLQLMVVKNSLARRAFIDTPLLPAVEGLEGPAALVWGGEDLISAAKEVVKLSEDKAFEPFEVRGGAMEGEGLDADRVKEISKWPNRTEMLSILAGQILGPGAQLNSQLTSAGGALASQISQKAEGEESAEA